MDDRELTVAASLYVTDHAGLRETVRIAEEAGADAIHVDVMDGSFVPDIAFGADVVAAIKHETTLPVDVHLQVDRPESHVERFVEAGADVLTIHWEATSHAHRVLREIATAGVRAGVALNPSSPAVLVEDLLAAADLLLVMTTDPGGSGFLEAMLPKVERVRRMVDRAGLTTPVAVDGGVGPVTAPRLLEAGANWLVTGTALFRDELPPSEVVAGLRSAGGVAS